MDLKEWVIYDRRRASGRDGERDMGRYMYITHTPVMSDKLHSVVSMATPDTVDADSVTIGALAREAAVEVVHGVRVVTRDGEETPPSLEGIF